LQQPLRDCSRSRLCILLSCVLIVAASGCAGRHALVRRETAGLAPSPRIAWFSPSLKSDSGTLARWRVGVGPPILPTSAPVLPTPVDEITVVSWNTALGEADLTRMARQLPRGRPVVLLLQEVYRGGPDVPRALPRDASFAGYLPGATAREGARQIGAAAAELGLSVYYVPSMRNGAPSVSDEDRGNAILSNLPLSDLSAIELPFEHQRRVAISATITGVTSGGAPWRVRLVNAHLDNMASARHGWVGGEYGRTRQARGLVGLLRDEVPTVLAGDFNTWFGASEKAYIETAEAFPQTYMPDTRPTFRGLLRLDHVFLRLSPGWTASFRRGNDRFGSDHYPLIGTLRFR
jgi:endonuclease/exonuclease/phosphatase family metal-dependent hydrolase